MARFHFYKARTWIGWDGMGWDAVGFLAFRAYTRRTRTPPFPPLPKQNKTNARATPPDPRRTFDTPTTRQVQGAAEGWSVVYYIFAFLKGTMRFVVVLLIGSGCVVALWGVGVGVRVHVCMHARAHWNEITTRMHMHPGIGMKAPPQEQPGPPSTHPHTHASPKKTHTQP